MRVAPRREMHADTTRAPDADNGVGHFEQQARTIFNRAAVAVRALVRTVLKKLIEKIAIGAVNLDAVETGEPGVLRPLAIGFDHSRNLLERKSAGDRIGLLGPHQADVTLRGDRARRDRQGAVQIRGMRNAADVPELQQNAPAGFMHRAGDLGPSLYLLLGPDARRVGIADAHWRDRGRFRQDEAGRSALNVIVAHQFVRNTTGARPTASQRGHDDTIW